MYYFFELLKEARKEKNYSQRKLAETLGVSQNAVCGWEKGQPPAGADPREDNNQDNE